MMLRKLAIITTHPIQYYAPVFQLLAKECHLKVFYTWGKASIEEKYDPDFKQSISWDIPLLEGYDYEFIENISTAPGSHHYSGIKNPDLIKRISVFNPYAILVYGWSYNSHLKVLRHFKNKIPVWFRGDSNLIGDKSNLKKQLRKIFLKWVYHYIDKAFYVGSANKLYYKEFGLRPSQLIFAPHAIDNDRFSTNHHKQRKSIRESLGLTENDILILFAGKLESNKNPELLLSAFSEINKNHIHLLFVGNGILEEKLKNNINKNIHFFDFKNQSQMPVIYQACDLFCLPSVSETWGLSVNEAMAAGKAILVSDRVGCAIDLVKIGENGFIFESNNFDDLKIKLSSLVANKKLLNEMGNKSAEMIKEWSIDLQAKIFLKQLNK